MFYRLSRSILSLITLFFVTPNISGLNFSEKKYNADIHISLKEITLQNSRKIFASSNLSRKLIESSETKKTTNLVIIIDDHILMECYHLLKNAAEEPEVLENAEIKNLYDFCANYIPKHLKKISSILEKINPLFDSIKPEFNHLHNIEVNSYRDQIKALYPDIEQDLDEHHKFYSKITLILVAYLYEYDITHAFFNELLNDPKRFIHFLWGSNAKIDDAHAYAQHFKEWLDSLEINVTLSTRTFDNQALITEVELLTLSIISVAAALLILTSE